MRNFEFTKHYDFIWSYTEKSDKYVSIFHG